MIGRQIGTMPFVLCAAPAYTERHGLPASVAALAEHRCVLHFSGRTGRAFDWVLRVDGNWTTVTPHGPIAVNNGGANLVLALHGVGLARVALYQARPHFLDGSLVPVLPDAPLPSLPISLLYPEGRMATPKLRVFAEWLTQLFDEQPDLRLVA